MIDEWSWDFKKDLVFIHFNQLSQYHNSLRSRPFPQLPRSPHTHQKAAKVHFPFTPLSNSYLSTVERALLKFGSDASSSLSSLCVHLVFSVHTIFVSGKGREGWLWTEYAGRAAGVDGLTKGIPPLHRPSWKLNFGQERRSSGAISYPITPQKREARKSRRRRDQGAFGDCHIS